MSRFKIKESPSRIVNWSVKLYITDVIHTNTRPFFPLGLIIRRETSIKVWMNERLLKGHITNMIKLEEDYEHTQSQDR
jgi:hypothetical protein